VRATNEPETQTSLTMRKLDRARRILVASPSLVERTGPRQWVTRWTSNMAKCAD